jgi:hypothetical protein
MTAWKRVPFDITVRRLAVMTGDSCTLPRQILENSRMYPIEEWRLLGRYAVWLL